MEVKDNWKDNESKSIHLQCKRGLTLCNRVVDHHREEDRTATEIFINKCLWGIVNTHWPDKIGNKELLEKLTRSPRWIYQKEENAWTSTEKKWRQHCHTSTTVDTTRTQRKTETLPLVFSPYCLHPETALLLTESDCSNLPSNSY